MAFLHISIKVSCLLVILGEGYSAEKRSVKLLRNSGWETREDVSFPVLKVLKASRFPVPMTLKAEAIGVGNREVEAMGDIRWVRTLIFRNVDTDHKTIYELRRFTTLQHLGLSATQSVDDSAVESILHLSHLRTLDLSGTHVTSKGLSRLGELRTLKGINLSRIPFGNESLKVVSKFKRLSTLELDDTEISNEGLSQIWKCKQLSYLSLNDNPGITDAAVKSISRIKSLRYLSVFGTRITAEGKAQLKKSLPETDIIGPE